jgi:hypothetical protein
LSETLELFVVHFLSFTYLTMKFSKLAVLMAIAPVASGFTAHQRIFTKPHASSSTLRMSALDDLESKLLGTPDPAPAPKKAERAQAPKPAPKVVVAPKSDPMSLEGLSFDEEPLRYMAPKPAPVPKSKQPKPVPVPKAEKPKPEPKAKVEKPKPAPKVEKPKPAPKPVVVKAPPAPKKVVAAKPKKVAPPAPPVKPGDATQTLVTGVALGAAPLALTGLAVLAAGRSALANTLERREKIQAELAERARAEAEKEARKKLTEVDGGQVTGALVRRWLFSCVCCV